LHREDLERGLVHRPGVGILILHEYEHGHLVTIEMRTSDIGKFTGVKNDLVEEIPKRREYDSRFLN
jgi:hypothetical protein